MGYGVTGLESPKGLVSAHELEGTQDDPRSNYGYLVIEKEDRRNRNEMEKDGDGW